MPNSILSAATSTYSGQVGRAQGGRSSWALVHAARAGVVVLGGCTAVLLDEAATAAPLWLPLVALVAVTAWIDLRHPIPALWAVDLVAVMAVRAWVDVRHGTEPLFALIGVSVAAGALGRWRGVATAVGVAGVSFALAIPESWDHPWRQLASSVAVVGLLAVGGRIIGIVDHRSREAGRAAAERSQRLQAVLSAVLRSDPRGIIVRDGEGRLVELNESARRMLDLDAAVGHLVTSDQVRLPSALVDRDERPVAHDELPSEAARRTGEVVTDSVLGVPQLDKWFAVTAIPVDTSEGRWVVTQLQDVTAETSTVLSLRHQAAVDPLTGVGNRRLLEWTVDDLIDPEEHVGVALIDMDDFKAVNDAHGHEIGDQVLRQIAKRLQALSRPDDVAVRLGGDEFLIVLRRLDAAEEIEDVDQIVARLTRALAAPYPTDAGLLDISCSIGWTTGSAVQAKALVREADRRMYASKHAAVLDLGPIDIRHDVGQTQES